MKRPFALAAFTAIMFPATAAMAGNPAEETIHVVKAGETIGGVANRAVVPRVLIIEANGLKRPYKLHAGQRLVIPRRRTHTVKAGETGFDIALQYGVTWDSIALANGLDPKKPVKSGTKLAIPTISKLPAPITIPPGSEPPKGAPAEKPSVDTTADGPHFAWPVTGKVLRGFTTPKSRDPHAGIDIDGVEGNAVRASAAGRVIYAGNEPRRYGILVIIDHGNGWATAYGKLQKVTVKKGERVGVGERIGLVGHTGETDRTELHFEIRHHNRVVDPVLLLEPR